MTIEGTRPQLKVPERMIPVPASVSPEAQAYLASGPLPAPDNPPLDDHDAWKQMIAVIDKMVAVRFHEAGGPSAVGFQIEELPVGDATVFAVCPPGLDPGDQRVYLELHGGAFIMGGGELCRAMAVRTAGKLQMRVWAADYRMPPDHPFPAAVDDCLAAYRLLLEDRRPQQIVIGGVSAGGNLAAAVVLRARDEGLPLPAAAALLTPAVDLSQSGDTFQTNLGVDTVLTTRDPSPLLLYAGGHELTHPYVSPLFGDVSNGFPPTLLASGTRDVLLSDTVRMHRRLRASGAAAELHVLEAAPHGFFGGLAPEDEDLDREVRRFVNDHCPAPTS
jgi:epsilon-lactone hydrolase